MCGIFCSASRHRHLHPPDTLLTLLKARGPDASSRICVAAPTAFLTLHSTVLSLRGSTIVSQPYRIPASDSTLCWNGEAWSIRGQRPPGNDTAEVFTLFHAAASQTVPPMDARAELFQAAQNISTAIAQMAGPHAFVFYDAPTSRLFFGRDFLGRRSLLWRTTKNGDLVLASLTDGDASDDWSEVEADGIYCVDLSTRTYGNDLSRAEFYKWGDFFIARAPYTNKGGGERPDASVIPLLSLNRDIPSTHAPINQDSASVSQLGQLLESALLSRVSDIPELPVAPHMSAVSAKVAILFSGGLDCSTLARIVHDILPVSQPVDLLNVAFENPRAHKGKEGSPYELCPDRITGLTSHAELCRVCPERDWRFVEINVPYWESLDHRPEVIRLMHPHNTEMDLSIAYALYFAARGQGLLLANESGERCSYRSSARVLLSGLGADELFAGYTRHATAFRRGSHERLLDELALDISRLGKRNLGRDDRVICHWGKEVRFPFLDEDLVGWALARPVTEKCDFFSFDCGGTGASRVTFDEIEPGKKVLRCLASNLGMKNVAKEKKRAIQFGSRTAKMETGKTKGTTPLSPS